MAWIVRPDDRSSDLPKPRAEDLAHAARRREPERRRATLERRLRLRALAARMLRIDASGVAVAQPADAGPVVAAPRPLYAALAARDGWSVIAASSAPIGVDIERIEPGAHRPLDLLHPLTASRLRDLDDLGFTQGWAALEAYLKLLGVGADGLPDAIVTRDRGFWTDDSRAAAQFHRFRLDGFAFAAATFA